MTHFVGASEIADLCGDLGLKAQETAVKDAVNEAAKALAERLGVTLVHTDNQPGSGGLFACFEPAHAGQKCPKPLARCDIQSAWALEEGLYCPANDDRTHQQA